LGNGVTGNTNSYNWTMPTNEPCLTGLCACVLRLRYNVSNAELAGWDNFADSTKNGKNSPVKTNPSSLIGNMNVTMAVDTSQFGRTFQDRSFVWNLIPRPSGVSASANIYNLNVRGKRGNIVQVYPSTEYDFVPKELAVKTGDYVHFQWTGNDNAGTNNAGEGLTATDRSNIVQIKSYSNQVPLKDTDLKSGGGSITPLFDTQALRYNMAFLGQINCKNYNDLLNDQTTSGTAIEQNPQNCGKLNGATGTGPNSLYNGANYFNGGLVQMNNTGNYYYMSSRNNAFSNRTQKALLIVNPLIPAWGVALIVIGSVAVAGAAGAAGSVFYAKHHPHSRLAGYVSRIPLLNRI